MKIIGITTAALAAATAIGISSAALAAPAGNLGSGQQTATKTDGVVQAQYYRYHNHGYYYGPYYRPYYYQPYYAPYYYGPPAFNFGIQIR